MNTPRGWTTLSYIYPEAAMEQAGDADSEVRRWLAGKPALSACPRCNGSGEIDHRPHLDSLRERERELHTTGGSRMALRAVGEELDRTPEIEDCPCTGEDGP